MNPVHFRNSSVSAVSGVSMGIPSLKHKATIRYHSCSQGVEFCLFKGQALLLSEAWLFDAYEWIQAHKH